MEYYKKRSKKKYISILVMIIIIFTLGNSMLYIIDKKIFPSIIQIAQMNAKSEIIDIINDESVNVLSGEYSYDKIVKIEKNNDGQIILLQMDTVKLNYIASQLSKRSNYRLNSVEASNIKIPMGWISQKSALYNIGPSISMDLEPVGNVIVTYESKFESGGINQTRHKIFLNVDSTVIMKLPLNSKELKVHMQVPICETIIVGDIPEMTVMPQSNVN